MRAVTDLVEYRAARRRARMREVAVTPITDAQADELVRALMVDAPPLPLGPAAVLHIFHGRHDAPAGGTAA